jgi:hypothetical protein
MSENTIEKLKVAGRFRKISHESYVTLLRDNPSTEFKRSLQEYVSQANIRIGKAKSSPEPKEKKEPILRQVKAEEIRKESSIWEKFFPGTNISRQTKTFLQQAQKAKRISERKYEQILQNKESGMTRVMLDAFLLENEIFI